VAGAGGGLRQVRPVRAPNPRCRGRPPPRGWRQVWPARDRGPNCNWLRQSTSCASARSRTPTTRLSAWQRR
jgi:hypothetical protein